MFDLKRGVKPELALPGRRRLRVGGFDALLIARMFGRCRER